MREILANYRPVLDQTAGTIDGGDVLQLGRTLYVGTGDRSSAAGLEWLREAVKPYGYEVIGVPIRGCLHLKTAVTQLSADTLLYNPAWVDLEAFAGWQGLAIDLDEPFAANVLLVGEQVVSSIHHPRTNALIAKRQPNLNLLDLSEMAKAEGALSCCSIMIW